MQIEGKTIWITGASSGIGAALAKAMAVKKCRLILSARNEGKLLEVQKTCTECGADVMVVQLDISDPNQIQASWEKVNEIGWAVDILINNSGISQRSLTLETPVELDRRIMEVNYFGAVLLTKLVAPTMVQRGSGLLVSISSLSGKFGWKQRSAYAASKFALIGFFESLAAELSGTGVGVLTVIPGRIKTDISLHAVTKDGTQSNQLDAAQKGGIPAEACASKIIKGILHNKKEIRITRMEGLMIHIRYWMPWLYFRIAANRDPNK